LLKCFGIEGGATSYRENVDIALDEAAAELESVLDKSWLAALMD
jgi:adenosylcobyric acid synthase